MINWLLNKRIEIVVNPKPYDRWSRLGQTKHALAPRIYFLWGYDIGQDMTVLAFRFGPKTDRYGIAGWLFDFTLQRRGPVWKWRRVRRDWSREAADNAKAAERAEKWRKAA